MILEYPNTGADVVALLARGVLRQAAGLGRDRAGACSIWADGEAELRRGT